jgi:hypothetical protein
MGELFKPWESLHPDLAEWVYEDELGAHLKHPLVFDAFYVPGMRDGMLNDTYEAKRRAVANAIDRENWAEFIILHERPYRLEALYQISDQIEDDCKFWRLVTDVWTDTENARQNYDEWEELFASERSCRESMMNEEEQAKLASLSSEIRIYRGFRFKEDEYDGIDGFSWTLSRDRAIWFAKRFAGAFEDTPQIATAYVRKADVIAYLNGRGEDEILVLPTNLMKIIERRSL